MLKSVDFIPDTKLKAREFQTPRCPSKSPHALFQISFPISVTDARVSPKPLVPPTQHNSDCPMAADFAYIACLQ